MLRRLMPLFVALISLSVSGTIAYLVHGRYLAEQDRRLQTAADRINQRLSSHVLVLSALKGAMSANRGVIDSAGLTAFMAALPDAAGLDSAQGFGFALAFEAGREDAARALGQKSYPTFPMPWPDARQGLRTSIIALEPQDARNRAALGFDMASEPVRRAAMERALRSRSAAVTSAVKLVQEIEGPPQNGILVYLPLFASDGVAMPEGAGRDDLIGFVYTPIRMGDLVRKVLSEPPLLPFAVEIFSGPPSEETRLHGAIPASRHVLQTAVRIADQTWTLRIAETGDPSMLRSPATFVMLLGGLAALLLGMAVRTHFHEHDILAALARETSARVESQQVLLGEMHHRVKNSIARKLALFRLTVRETSNREALVSAFEARMQALAKAQDLLLSAPDRGVSIRRMLDDEVGMWRNMDRPVQYSGPEIELHGSQLQALALIFHELTTNSLKYGALAHGGALSVTWAWDAAAGGSSVTLAWREIVPEASSAEAGQGFGSRLIRMMAEGQLGGWSKRALAGGVLEVSIGFPVERRGTVI